MKNQNQINIKGLQALASLLVMLSMLLLPGGGWATGASETPALVRLDLPSAPEQQTLLLESLKMLTFGRFYTPEGGSFLLLEAKPRAN